MTQDRATRQEQASPLEQLREVNRRLEQQIAELRSVNAELVRANAVKTRFLTQMSHEVRAPLHTIQGYAELLGDESYGVLSDEQRRFVKHVSEAGRLLTELLSDVMDLAKIEAGKIELDVQPMNVNRAAEQAARIVQGVARNGSVAIRIETDEQEPVALADERRVKQVLVNLLSNAIRYSPEGSSVDVHVSGEGEWIKVCVRDEGIGIAPEDQERIFEEFVRAGPDRDDPERTGLGLPLSRELVKLHGGEMNVDSAPGKGSTFWFTLPVATPPEEAEARSEGAMKAAERLVRSE